MKQHPRIFIIGHPGAGKTLAAKTIAEKLGWQFVDADFGLEARIGRSLSEIIGEGEKSFAECQAEIIANLLHKKEIVVATDVSLLDSEKTKKLLTSEFVVYLKVSVPIQIERTSRSAETLLPIENYREFLESLHHKRDNLFEKAASLIINADDSALEKHVAKIINAVAGDVVKSDEKITLDKNDLIIFHKTLHTPVHLSDQQARCLKLLAQGKTSKEIANELELSYRTVEDYLAKTMEQLGCASSKELIALYHDQP